MAKTFDEGKNLSEQMHVLRAIEWGIQAQEWDVIPTTIQSCWRRSQCIDFGIFPAPPVDTQTESEETVNSIRTFLYIMRQRGVIQSVPNIHEYISPYSGPQSEQVDDHGELKELVDDIIAENTQQEVDLEDEVGQAYIEPLPPVLDNEAL